MKYEPPLEKISENIREAVLGHGEKALKIGGENTLPFHSFEGTLPNPPGLAQEILDTEPENWAPSVLEPFEDVVSDPVNWARKCVEVFGAEMLCLRLVSTDPLGKDGSPQAAAEITKKVADAVDVPLIVWGTNMDEKDAQVLTEVGRPENRKLDPISRGDRSRWIPTKVPLFHCRRDKCSCLPIINSNLNAADLL